MTPPDIRPLTREGLAMRAVAAALVVLAGAVVFSAGVLVYGLQNQHTATAFPALVSVVGMAVAVLGFALLFAAYREPPPKP